MVERRLPCLGMMVEIYLPLLLLMKKMIQLYASMLTTCIASPTTVGISQPLTVTTKTETPTWTSSSTTNPPHHLAQQGEIDKWSSLMMGKSIYSLYPTSDVRIPWSMPSITFPTATLSLLPTKQGSSSSTISITRKLLVASSTIW
ncbi:hypothetical protein CPB83DRAFT_865394 [Crepidotus variabilis]|uniref:Uncharacterized protein n=1 Tax=Crepidotus variabilis TaxID=179855 RepID=A0A9P6E339_9AGAR|nr:hypothetical protein CPB83DRAFT_865394 [Crepidotus variabilis]